MLNENIHITSSVSFTDRTMTKNSHYVLIVALMVLLVAGAGFAGCTGTTPQQTTPVATVTTTQPVSTPAATPVTVVATPVKPAGTPQTLLVATTTSLYDTGLLDYLQPMFEKQYRNEAEDHFAGDRKSH